MIVAYAEAPQASLSKEPTAGIEEVVSVLEERGKDNHDFGVSAAEMRLDPVSGEMLVGRQERRSLRLREHGLWRIARRSKNIVY